MVHWDDNAENWEYRGEGNFHVIIAHNKNKTVLRLPKRYKDAEKRRNDVLVIQSAAENEISFQKHVVIPLMRHCRACVQNQLVKLSTKFLSDIDQLISSSRPLHRQHKELDKTSTYGVLLPDFSYVLPPPPIKSSSTHDICIEIKPKKGFLDMYGNCTYCNLQLVKVKKGVYNKVSSYCPLDLFSGNKDRMKNAFKGLIKYPQNNFRVFRNGQLIYSEEICTKNSNIFMTSVLPSIFPDKDNRINVFMETLYQLLTYQLVTKLGERHLEQCCPMKSIVKSANICSCSKKNGAAKIIEQEYVKKISSLPAGCVLDLILNVQKLEDCSLDEYCEMYPKLKENNLKESLQASFHEELWQNTIRSILNTATSSQSTPHDHMQSIQKFLIATSFKDCSILLSLRQTQHDTCSVSNLNNLPILIDTGMGSKFWGSIAVIDCDPKPVNRIPHYAKIEAESALSWKDFLLSKK